MTRYIVSSPANGSGKSLGRAIRNAVAVGVIVLGASLANDAAYAQAQKVITCPSTQTYTPVLNCQYAPGWQKAGACQQGAASVTVNFKRALEVTDLGCGPTRHCITCQYESPGIASASGNPISQTWVIPRAMTCSISGATATCVP